jgi:hypothetical protein
MIQPMAEMHCNDLQLGCFTAGDNADLAWMIFA